MNVRTRPPPETRSALLIDASTGRPCIHRFLRWERTDAYRPVFMSVETGTERTWGCEDISAVKVDL